MILIRKDDYDMRGAAKKKRNGDYLSIGTQSANFIATQAAGSNLGQLKKDLYNGNIGAMVTTITHPDTREVLPLGNAYRYDQLNRLAEARSFTNLNSSSNAWGSGQAALYYNAFSYDANGNIATQERWNGSNQQIDKLTYNYKKDGNGKVLRNRLYGVTDLVNSGDFTDDIDNMVFTAGSNIESVNNYSYDQEGRLVKDIQEEIESIEWRVDGKVKKINRPAGSQKKNVSFDYDAMGHRIAKHVMNAQNQLEISTYYLLDASGNTMAVYEREVDAANASVTFTQEEKYIYGSTRLGALNDSIPLLGTQNDSYSQTSWIHTIGQRTYELANHLGNVLSVISDKVIPHNNGGNVDYYMADIRQAQDYSPFGVTLYGRNFTASGANGFRYGFNSMEKDDEIKGEGNSYDFGARMYDPRLGRWLTIDPLAAKYPNLSPYVFVGNMPTIAIDPDGKDIIFTVTKREDGKIIVHATLNAKLVDQTHAGITADKMGEYKDRIQSAITEYYTYNGTGSLYKVMDDKGELVSGPFEMSITVNLEVSKELGPNDHAIYITDPGHLRDEDDESCVAPADVLGLTEPGSNYVYLSSKILENKPEPVPPGGSPAPAVGAGEDRAGYAGTGLTASGEASLERTASHELGHNLLGEKNAALGHAIQFVNNLMTGSSQKHHAGTKLHPTQINAMINEYQKGHLNSGVQEGPEPSKN